MISTETNAWGRACGVEWLSVSDRSWRMRTLRGVVERPLDEIRKARPRIERHGDRRLGDAVLYCAIAVMAAPALLPDPWATAGFLTALVLGALAGLRWATGVLAIDITHASGESETVRLWDTSAPVLDLARHLDRATGGPGIVS